MPPSLKTHRPSLALMTLQCLIQTCVSSWHLSMRPTMPFSPTLQVGGLTFPPPTVLSLPSMLPLKPPPSVFTHHKPWQDSSWSPLLAPSQPILYQQAPSAPRRHSSNQDKSAIMP